MTNYSGQNALYRKYNPTSLDDVCGNSLALSKCGSLISMRPSQRPGFYLVSGATGTGKSTLTHILVNEFGCDIVDVFNSREAGNVDFVREFLKERLPALHLTAHARAYIFEEAHNITVAAQEMFMEPLEKGIPENTYVFFVTNSPEKLTGGKGALVSRPFVIKTERVKPKDMIPRLLHICEEEELPLSDDDVTFCAANADGSVRVAINHMSRLASVDEDLIDSEKESIRLESDMTGDPEVSPSVRNIAIALETGSWNEVIPALKAVKDAGEDPEGIRRGLLAWYAGILLSTKRLCVNKRAYARACIDTLRDNYYSTGFAGLVGDLSHLVTEGIE